MTRDADRVHAAHDLLLLERTPPHRRGGLGEAAMALEAQAQSSGDETLAHRARLIQADALSRNGQDAAASRLLREANRWAVRTGQRYLVARSHRHLAALALAGDDIEIAFEHAQRCVQNTEDDVDPAIAADHAMVLAVTLAANGRKAAAMAEFDRADSLAVFAQDVWLRLHLLNNRAFGAFVCDDPDLALDVATDMVSVADAEGLTLTPGMLETHGRVLLATGLARAALRALQPGIDLEPEPGATDAAEIAACRLTVAQVQVALGMVDEAFATLDACEDLADRLSMRRLQASVCSARAKLYATQERYKEAYEEQVRYQDLAGLVVNRSREGRTPLSPVPDRDLEPELSQVTVYNDPLTGLPNRRFVASRLPELLTVMAGHDLPLGVAMIGVDGFAALTSAVGADEANTVLVAFADILEWHLGEHAFAARLNGAEFLIVLPAADEPLVAAFCEQVRADLHAFRWVDVSSRVSALTASFGVAVAHPDDELSQMELLRLADENLYRAKRAGRDTVIADLDRDPERPPFGGPQVQSQILPAADFAPAPRGEWQSSAEEAGTRWWNKEIKLSRGR